MKITLFRTLIIHENYWLILVDLFCFQYLILELKYNNHYLLFYVPYALVMGSRQWPLLRLDIYGSIRVDGQSCHKPTRNSNGTLIGGLGGGSGGTILLFLQGLALAEGSSLSVAGGYGGPLGGGGGGGGRIHFHWSKIAIGDEYVPLAFVDGMMNNRYACFHGTLLYINLDYLL